MATRHRAARGNPPVVSINSNTYVCRSIRRVVIDDWPQPVPTSGRQTGATRWPLQTATLGDITNAYGGLVALLSDEENEHFAHGHIHETYDSEAETRYGWILLPRKNNAVTFPAHDTDGDVAGDGSNPSNQNPHAAIYYAGTANSGVFTWLTDDATTGDVFAIVWGGTSWADAFTIVSNANANLGFDVAVHKGELLYLYRDNTTPVVAYSTTGNTLGGTYANNPAGAITPLFGSRLLDDGNTLYAWAQVTASFNLYKTTDKGATAWTTVFTAWPGKIRDVGHYYDKSGTYSVVVLTEVGLYKLNTTTSLLEELLVLPFAGRALTVVDGWLHIYLDAGRVWRVSPDWEQLEDISPGGQQRMPTGKAFDTDTSGQVCVASGLSGPYVMWGGDTVGGSDEAILILQWVRNGWHYIGKVADANNASPLRFIYLDPTSGDLIGAYNTTDGNIDLSTGFQYKDVEVDPTLLSSLDVETSGFVTLQRTSFGAASVSTTLFRVYITSDDVDATETVTPKYGLEGASETTTSLTAITADNGSSTFPSTSSAVGVNFTTIQLHLALASGGATLSPKIIDATFEYIKMPTTRYIYLFEIDLGATAARRQAAGISAIISELKTNVIASKTKLAVAYADENSLSLIPLPRAEVEEHLHGAVDFNEDVSEGIWMVALAET